MGSATPASLWRAKVPVCTSPYLPAGWICAPLSPALRSETQGGCSQAQRSLRLVLTRPAQEARSVLERSHEHRSREIPPP
jgi:hypothetical protein